MPLHRRLTVAVLSGLLVTVSLTAPVVADRGGTPNPNACHGQLVKRLNAAGLTPHDIAVLAGVGNAGVVNKAIKSGLCP